MASDLVFGKYEIIRRIAVGGMGEIFLARQIGVAGFDRRVILKSLLPSLAEDPLSVDRFLDEARVAAKLNHPNIVSIHEVGEHRGAYFMAMEYVEGEDLGSLIRLALRTGERIEGPIAARIGVDVARALDHAHHAQDERGPLGIVHRDVSPSNIMLRTDGLAKVLDFGVAWAVMRRAQTATGAMPGKLRYMSPEQIDGRKLDGRSDQFSLGVVLWELLTRAHLFDGPDNHSALRGRLEHAIRRPSEIASVEVDEELESVIMRMLARDPDERFASCAQVALALEAHVSRVGGDPTGTAALVRRLAGDRIRTRGVPEASEADLADTRILSANLALGSFGRDTLPLPARSEEARPPPPKRWPLLLAFSATAMVAVSAIALLERQPEPEPWVTVFRDDFERAELGPGWKVLRGEVETHEGALCARFGHAVSTHAFGEAVRLEYEARVMPDSPDARELSAFISGSRSGGLVDGYSFEFGIVQDLAGYGHGIQRLRKLVNFTAGDPIVRGRSYSIAIERDEDRLEMSAGGESLFTFVDPVPLKGEAHAYLGFGSKAGHLHYDRVRVSLPLRHARVFAARSLELREWAEAEVALAAVAEHEIAPGPRAWLEIQHVRALLRQGQVDRADRLLAKGAASRSWRRHARALEAEILARRGDPEAGYTRLLEAKRDPELAQLASGKADSTVQAEALLEIFRAMEALPAESARSVVEGALARTTQPDRAVLEATVTMLFDRGVPLAPELLPKALSPHLLVAYPYRVVERSLDRLRAETKQEPRAMIEILATAAIRALAEDLEEEARTLAEEASLLQDRHAGDPSRVLAYAWAFLGDEERALAYRARWIDDSAGNATVIANVLLALGRDEDAWRIFEAIADRWGGEGSGVHAAQAQFLIGRWSHERLDAFVSVDPTRPWGEELDRELLLGLAALREGDRSSARTHFEKVPSHGSGDRAFKHLLAKRRLDRYRAGP